MIERLFRGKRTDNGEWIEGAYIQVDVSENFCYIMPRYNLASSLPPLELVPICAKKVKPETVGLYIGKDKNGKRIFEGDIVEEKYGDNKYRYTVIYERGLFFPFADDLCCEDVEVLGNIYDNRELLEVR